MGVGNSSLNLKQGLDPNKKGNKKGHKNDDGSESKKDKSDQKKSLKKSFRFKNLDVGKKLPVIKPSTRCKLKILKLNRVKDWLLLEEEFIKNVKANGYDKNEVNLEEKIIKNIRGNPLIVATLQEIVDEKHG